MIQTEYRFTLPVGCQADDGSLHRHGTMRLATAGDEIIPLKDPRVQANPGYLICILLSRVITIDGVSHMNPGVIEKLYARDVAHLQELYNRVNRGEMHVPASCPKCSHGFDVEVSFEGELLATP